MICAMIEIAGFKIEADHFLFRLLYCIFFLIISVVINRFVDGKVKKRAEEHEDSSGECKDGTKFGNVIVIVAKILIVVVFLSGKYLLFDGQSLPHKPDKYNVSSVVVEYPDYLDTIEEYDNELIVKAAVAILSELDYYIFKKAPECDPSVKITYIMKDNTKITVEANDETVWWSGKAYAIKDEGEFIKSCRLLFHDKTSGRYGGADVNGLTADRVVKKCFELFEDGNIEKTSDFSCDGKCFFSEKTELVSLNECFVVEDYETDEYDVWCQDAYAYCVVQTSAELYCKEDCAYGAAGEKIPLNYAYYLVMGNENSQWLIADCGYPPVVPLV